MAMRDYEPFPFFLPLSLEEYRYLASSPWCLFPLHSEESILSSVQGWIWDDEQVWVSSEMELLTPVQGTSMVVLPIIGTFPLTGGEQ